MAVSRSTEIPIASGRVFTGFFISSVRKQTEFLSNNYRINRTIFKVNPGY